MAEERLLNLLVRRIISQTTSGSLLENSILGRFVHSRDQARPGPSEDRQLDWPARTPSTEASYLPWHPEPPWRASPQSPADQSFRIRWPTPCEGNHIASNTPACRCPGRAGDWC